MADDLTDQYEDLSNSERYESAEGWQPAEERESHEVLDAYRKANPSEFCRESMFTAKTARAWQREIATTPPMELFGPLWRKGELAVLFGSSGSGKSILAVQIAESIARGKPLFQGSPPYEGGVAAFRGRGGSLRQQEVLYFDFERSPAQFAERYSCPSPLLGQLPVRYRFSPRLKIARIGDTEIPEIFQGNFSAYFEHSLALTAETGGDKVIIVDNLSWLDIKTTSPAASIRRMRTLKRCCMMTGTSILVLHSGPPCFGGVGFGSPAARGGVDTLRGRGGGRRGGSSGLQIPNSMFRIFEPADSVFAIGHSTFAPEMRYVKPLKSSGSPPCLGGVPEGRGGSSDWALSPGEVLTYQLARTQGFGRLTALIPHSTSSPPARGGVAETPLLPEEGWPKAGVVGASDEVVGVAAPFLGLTYLGPSNESDHLRDYAAEALAADLEHKRELRRLARRSATQALIEGMSDGTYKRYLKGE